jgi:hypothetical protein
VYGVRSISHEVDAMTKLFRAKTSLPLVQIDSVNVVHDVEVMWLYASQRAVSLQQRFHVFTYPSNVFIAPGGNARREHINRIADSLFVEEEMERFVTYATSQLKMNVEVMEHPEGDEDCYRLMLYPIPKHDELIFVGDHGEYVNSRTRFVLHYLPYKLPGYYLPFEVAGEIRGVREWIGVSYPEEFSAYENIVAPEIS